MKPSLAGGARACVRLADVPRARYIASIVTNLSFERGSWSGRSVFMTGHTGFKGSWLSLWLHRLGAAVHGYALDPPTNPAIFDVARVGETLASDTRADLADGTCLAQAMTRANPEIVLHLAAQPLVRESYRAPLLTFETNVMGTARVLETVRTVPSVRAVVVVTTDKVYENLETVEPFLERDPLGGHDPYSASKAAAEIVTASFRASFYSGDDGPKARIATARAGNVIGGGDWAIDRLVPDCLRAFAAGTPAELRFPNSVRPWQHVLEPLAGYLKLAIGLAAGAPWDSAWNFGPDTSSTATVGRVAQILAETWGGGATVREMPNTANPHEAGHLRLDSTKAHSTLSWRPRLSLADALERTLSWQKAFEAGADMQRVTLEQIDSYSASL